MKFKFSTNKILGPGIALLLLSFITIIVFFSYEYKKVNDTAIHAAHTQEQLLYCQKLTTFIKDIETGTRAYILTGQKIFLQPAERSEKEIYTAIASLKTLAVNNPAQKMRIDSLLFYVDQRVTFFNRTKASYEIFGAVAAKQMADRSEGKFYTDRIDFLVDKIQAEENILQAQYQAANEKNIQIIDRILMLIIVVILLLSAVFVQKTMADNVEKGKITAALKKINDELEQRVADRTQQLDKKEKLFRALVENNEGIICLIDEKLNVLFRSGSTALITGRNFTENEQVAIAEYLHPDDRINAKALMNEVIASPGKAVQISMRLRHHKGHYISLEGVAKNMTHDPAIGGIITNLRDVSERKKAEEAIKKAVERYDILARATSDTIWDWDIANNTMHYNDGITQMFGYHASEVENVVDWWNEKLHPDDFKKVTEMIEDVFGKGLQKFQLTYRFRCADGTYKYIFDRAYVLFDVNGNPNRMIGAMQDITYHVDEELRISKAIIDAQEQERRFIGGELHDNVNQILAGSLLALNMVKGGKTITKKTMEFINMGKAHIFNAIDEVRKLSHKLAPASFDDSSLKDAIENLLQTFNVNNQFNIKLQMDEECNTINGDLQINLYRILQEQLKNIVKYAAASDIEIVLKLSGNLIVMRIYDNGKGFDVKLVKKGIGLSNIKKRVQSFSGKFIINSSCGKGCEIMVEIPLKSAPAKPAITRSKKIIRMSNTVPDQRQVNNNINL